MDVKIDVFKRILFTTFRIFYRNFQVMGLLQAVEVFELDSGDILESFQKSDFFLKSDLLESF